MVDRRIRAAVFSLLFILIFSGPAFSEKKPVLLILPFEINAKEDLNYLQAGIPEIISLQLQKEGAVLKKAGDAESAGTVRFGDAMKAGRAAGADYVIWGSFTRIGKKISLDARMLGTSGGLNPEYFFAEGDGIDNLPVALNRISMNIGIKAFGFETISSVEIKGNERIEADAIFQVTKVKKGDRYQKGELSKDLDSIYQMGYFDDIRIDAEPSIEKGGGVRIIFTVKEKPTIKKIRFKGNKALDAEKIEKELTIPLGSILNSNKINSNIKQIESLYVEKHYYNTKVTYKTYPDKNNQVILDFVIEEGEKVRIKKIVFQGNKSVKSKKLRKLMKTKQHWFFSWITSSDTLDMADLKTDLAIIGGDYQKKGFIDVVISEPEIRYEGKWIFITVKIDEGIQYKTGAVDIKGDMVLPREELLEMLKIKDEKFCNKEVIQNDIIALSDAYSDKGYANVNVNPRLLRDSFKKTASIVFDVEKGNQVYFEKIVIGGNIVTRDKVIRRELKVFENELYSGSDLKRSIRNLYRLDYFEDVKANTRPGSGEDKVNLMIGVEEKPTGTFTLGMGYSSQDKFFGTLAVSKRNLFGRSQTLNLETEFGEKSKKYSVSFIEPWLFDIPLYSKVELRNWIREYDLYDKNTIGGGLTLGYPVWDYTTFYSAYAYEINKIENVDDGDDVAESIKALEGETIARSITNTLRYDSRDRRYNAQATEGSNHSISVEYAGGFVGGDEHFIKYIFSMGKYWPLPLGFIGVAHSEFGLIKPHSGDSEDDLPDYEKFYLGGSGSVRGFEWRSITARDDDDNEIGGDKMAQLNFELLRPLFGTEGFLGVLFHDLGNVYGNNNSMNLNLMRRTWGVGIRWYSPLGPIRLERGFIIDRLTGDEGIDRWDFNMSGSF